MQQTAMERIGQYVKSYNEARGAGNAQLAVQYGELAVREARDELAKPSLYDAHRNYYKTVVDSIQPFLDNPVIEKKTAAASKGGAKGSEEEDKIKSTDWFAAPIPDLGFKDIAGLEDVRHEFIFNIFAPLEKTYSDIYEKYRGKECGLQVLLYGPPGTGKTHVVKCLAGQMGCKIAVVQIKDVMANLVGDGAKIIAEIFEQAKQYDKCIIFFDEIDAIASSREGDDSRHTKEQLTTLLTNMDGFTSKAKPGQLRIVIAATNRPWALDSAVKRGGRFDTQIYVPLPDPDARQQLARLALGMDERVKNRVQVPCADDVTLDWLVERFEGYAGADIKAICRQAISRPLRREILSRMRGEWKSDCVTRADFEDVLSRYINSITDESLMWFDAYRMNMEYGSEYARVKCEQIIKNLWAKDPVRYPIEQYELRWFKDLWESGYVEKEFGKKYDLKLFVEEELYKRLKK